MDKLIFYSKISTNLLEQIVDNYSVIKDLVEKYTSDDILSHVNSHLVDQDKREKRAWKEFVDEYFDQEDEKICHQVKEIWYKMKDFKRRLKCVTLTDFVEFNNTITFYIESEIEEDTLIEFKLSVDYSGYSGSIEDPDISLNGQAISSKITDTTEYIQDYMTILMTHIGLKDYTHLWKSLFHVLVNMLGGVDDYNNSEINWRVIFNKDKKWDF